MPIQTESAVQKLAAIATEFHIRTGADMELIKQFIKDIGDITSDFTMEVMRDQVARMINPDN
jgi:hypothetical protein